MTLMRRLAEELGLGAPGDHDNGSEPVKAPLASSLGVGELAWASVAVAGYALSGADIRPPLPDQVAAAFRSDHHLRIDGSPIDAFAALSGFWRTADGWVRTHGNYPHHAAALRLALDLPEAFSREQATEAFAAQRAEGLAAEVRAAGGVCVALRHEDPNVDAALRTHPLIDIQGGGSSPTRALPHAKTERPLTGVRVLDLTRVLAGPIATRTLALAGADVLRIDPPDRPEIAWQHLDTGHGKRSALLDITQERDRFDALLADADVLVLGYRPVGLAARGLDPRTLRARHPQLVIGQLGAWPGAESPRGFDSIVQADCGISWIEAKDADSPGALPAQALDHSAGYLLAAGITMALRHRAAHGGSWFVRTSLRRVAAELLGLSRQVRELPTATAPRMQEFEVAGTRVRTVAPAVRWPGGPELFAAPRPWGSDVAEW